MPGDWLTIVLATFVGLLPIVNPFSTAVVFLALTGRMTEAERQRQATLACCYATGVLWVFLFAGAVLTHDGVIRHEATRKAVEG